MEAVLVTGGAGYIGSHTVKVLLDKGYEVVVVDDLSTGHKEAVLTDHFYQGDIADQQLIQNIVRKHDIDAVIHFAAKSLVGESMVKPDYYFSNNIGKSIELFSALIKSNVSRIVFSSTAAVYGLPQQIPIKEDTTTFPINPYGESKLMVEKVLSWLDTAYGLKWCALRYFNAAGADLSGIIGEDHQPETHLIPLIFQTALGQREFIRIFGTDYETQDGTCIRDYIHVLDIAEAHVLALESLKSGMKSQAFNLGTGAGYSVREIIEGAEHVIEDRIKVVESPRREGDPAELVAEVQRVYKELGWAPKYSEINMILETAWKWHSSNPYGYGK